jgi:hypothetical protein
MLELIRKSLSILLAWLLIASATAPAQTNTPATAAPIPPQVLSAQSVFVSNGGGGNYFEAFTGGSNRAYNTLYAELQRSNRYQLVSSPSQADVIFEIRGIAPAVTYGDTVGTNPQLILSVIDPKTQAVLWTTGANVRAFGNQKHRDSGLDESVAVVVNKFGEDTGQPLTPSQAKAVRDNSRMPSAAKVLLFVGIAAVAGLASYGFYRVNHPPKLTLPPMPANH